MSITEKQWESMDPKKYNILINDGKIIEVISRIQNPGFNRFICKFPGLPEEELQNIGSMIVYERNGLLKRINFKNAKIIKK